MKPIMIPGLPLSGDTSKVTLTGPFSLTTWPVRPLSRQNGVVDRLELHQRALRHVLGELVAQRRQRRLVVDARREHRRDGHDHALPR